MTEFKFPHSAEGIRDELDYFKVPMTDRSVESCHYEKKHSLTNINEPYGAILFEHLATSGSHIDLKNSYLYVRGKVVKTAGTALPEGEAVSTSNLLLHSLFENATLSLNGTTVSDAENNYPYIAYNNILSRHGEGTKTSELTSQLFYMDDKPGTGGDTNTGFKARKGIIAESALVEMCGKLELDIFNAPRYIPPGVNLTLRLTKANPEFWLWTEAEPTGGVPYKFVFEECVFVMRKINVYPAIAAKHEAQVKRSRFYLPTPKTVMRTFTAPSGTYNFQAESLFGGRLPERLLIQFVDASAYTDWQVLQESVRIQSL